MVASSIIGTKYDPTSEDIGMKAEEGAKVVVEDDMLTGDCIMNYKTVASFGSDEVIMQE
jgi:hypothetical protein